MKQDRDWVADFIAGLLIFAGFLASIIMLSFKEYTGSFVDFVVTLAICDAVIYVDRHERQSYED